MVHAPCNAIVYEDNGEMSMSDPALFQPKAPLLPIGLVVVFATATAAASWGLGLVGQVLQRGDVSSSNTATSSRCNVLFRSRRYEFIPASPSFTVSNCPYNWGR